MPDITISTEEKEKPAVQDNQLVEQMKKADEYQKLKLQNDKLEAELQRREELKAKMAVGGRAFAGTAEKTEQELGEEEGTKLYNQFR